MLPNCEANFFAFCSRASDTASLGKVGAAASVVGVFCNSGENLLLYDGRLLSTLDGALIARISEEVG